MLGSVRGCRETGISTATQNTVRITAFQTRPFNYLCWLDGGKTLNIMEVMIVILGLSALLVWGFILYRASLGSLSWYSPAGLVSIGFLVFYILPPLYFQFRPWVFFVPNYFESIPTLLTAVLLFSFPFLIVAVHGAARRKGARLLFYRYNNYFGEKLWLFLIP